MNCERLGRKCATLGAVLVVAFLCGWSATGLTGGVATAAALGAGVAVVLFGEARTDCSLRLPGRWGKTRSS